MNSILRHLIDRETLTYIFVWVLIFMAPVLILYSHAAIDGHVTFRWVDVLSMWQGLAPMLVVFIIHSRFVAPLLLVKQRTRTYVFCALLLVVAFACARYAMRPLNHVLPPPPREMPPPSDNPKDKGHESKRGSMLGVPPFDVNEMMSVMVVMLLFGANVGVKSTFMSWETKRRRQNREKEYLKQELEYLKYQMNPHFFMNTLNNIHALVDIEPERAKVCIVELSQMMRYMLYECSNDTVQLSRVVDMLKNYVTLMRIRFNDNVDITFTHPSEVPYIELPPLLVIPFVENAFKHGVSYISPSYVHIDVQTTPEHIVLVCDNSKHHTTGDEHGGVGIPNVVKRLDLIYGSRYRLLVDDQPERYHMQLLLPISCNK